MDCVGYVVKWVHGWFRRLWRISAHSGSLEASRSIVLFCLFSLLAKFSRKERYCGNVLAAAKVLKQGLAKHLRLKLLEYAQNLVLVLLLLL